MTAALQPAAELWPESQRIITERALAGKLTDAERREAEWKGFEVPVRPAEKTTFWRPLPAPVTPPQDLMALLADVPGCFTVPQILQLPPSHPTRWQYDHPERSHKMGSLFAQGRDWACERNPWEKARAVELRPGTLRNAPARVKFEQQRAAKATKAAQAKAAAQPSLTALFFGKEEALPVLPRYTTPEEANEHTLQQRQNWQAGMRDFRAQVIRKVRRLLAQESEEMLTAWFTEWQRRGGGFNPSHLADFIRQKHRQRTPPAAQ